MIIFSFLSSIMNYFICYWQNCSIVMWSLLLLTDYSLDVIDMSPPIDVGMVVVWCQLSIFVGQFFRNSLCQNMMFYYSPSIDCHKLSRCHTYNLVVLLAALQLWWHQKHLGLVPNVVLNVSTWTAIVHSPRNEVFGHICGIALCVGSTCWRNGHTLRAGRRLT